MMMMKMVMKMVCVMTSDDGNDSYCGMDGEIDKRCGVGGGA